MFGGIYKGKKVLVTGNTGFKGAWLTIWLNQIGAEVYGISNEIPTQPSIFEVCSLAQNLKHEFLNVLDFQSLKQKIDEIRPDFIFHLAAQAIVSDSYSNPLNTFNTNIIGTANVLEAVRVLDFEVSLIMITSDKCYENVEWTWGYRENDRLGGKDPYSASKGGAELVIHSYYESFFKKNDSKVKLVSVRAGNVIGGGDWAVNRIVPDAMRSWSKNLCLVIRSPYATRPWQHVLEPLSGYLTAGMKLFFNNKLSGESYNFGPNSDQSHTVLELLTKLSSKWNKSTLDEMVQVEKSSFHEAGLLKLNCDKALHDLDWKPTLNFEQTIEFTSDWYFEYYKSEKIDLSFLEKQIILFSEVAKSKKISWASM
ncbi:MAG: CDP-glucose 4,6-dehydratase [Flavobacteriia bacterium]|nr:CDP-glucose 4,6-dehydratase [Flavobacteriia bacterium]